MSPTRIATLRNGQAVPLEVVPVVDVATFQAAMLAAVREGERVASLFGMRLPSGAVRLYAVLADDTHHALAALAADVRATYPSLTPSCPQVHLFEREVFEQEGAFPEGHPWLKPVRAHDFPRKGEGKSALRHPFFAMNGEGVHEVAVGPVHAGVIEPGHFRFQCQGETVHHLEVHLGYQHRGVEEALIGGPHKRTMIQMETVAGDTTIGHGTAHCLAMEALAGVEAPPRARALRAVALELERLANHVGDMGALANDVGYLPTASYCGRLRGDFLNMTALVCGSRLGRGLARPGGVAFDVDDTMVTALLDRLARAERDVREAVDLFFGSDSVHARLEGTCPLTAQACVELGIVGVAARACGLPRDVRMDHPTGGLRRAPVPVATWPSGDVFARAMVRRLEIERSAAFVREQLGALPPGPVRTTCPPPRPGHLAVALAEGWRGEVAHVAITDSAGCFARYKVVDASFHNWTGLAMTLRGQQISDFPLGNKSFNLSYCGFDL
ncbi:MAG: hydrogenase [Dehalococcoidia bacterium]|nr:hydrogenase [Dehalococcoidia bacterium]